MQNDDRAMRGKLETDRRGLLKCGAWAGAGVLWTLRGGIAASALLTEACSEQGGTAASTGPLSFVQISDTHIGFNKPANPDPAATLRAVFENIRASPVQPRFILHTRDITHLATPEEFDNARQILGELDIPIHYVPGEHDMLDETPGKAYRERFGAGSSGDGWYSFDADGVHFIGLVNVAQMQPGGFGSLGADQITWLRNDVAALPASTPIIVFAHIPLWTVYQDWGWGTADAAEALAILNRFGSVTVLNGHIHQIQQKVEGNVTFHTARSTAYPQPQPGAAPSPGPLAVPPQQLPSMLGLTSVRRVEGAGPLALTDSTLASI